MTRIKINPKNWSGRTSDVLDVFGQKVKVSSEWVEIADDDLKTLGLNPNLYEIEGEEKKKVAEEKPVKKKK